MYLVYCDKLGGTRSFHLDWRRSVTLGRETGCDFVLADRQVSRRHASIETVSESYLLRDSGSANGTFLNGLRLSGASAIALRDGDVIELGGLRLCFAADVAQALATLTPLATATGKLHESRLLYQDLLRDGLSASRGEDDPFATTSQVLRAFSDRPIAYALKSTLDHLVLRLELDVAAAFLRRRESFELVAARPSEQEGHALAQTLKISDLPEVPRLLYRNEGSSAEMSPTETLTLVGSRSAAVVPFFRGSTLLGVLAAERFRGQRLDRKAVAIVAVYGDRVARALSIRGGSPNDTPVGVGEV